MRRRIVIPAGRPEFWLGLLLVWALLSALRSWHTPWARMAGTEALRWAAGLALALALGRGLPRLRLATQAMTVLLAALVLTTLAVGVGPAGMVTGPFRDHQLCASALLLLLPFAAALALTADTPAWRWGAQIVALAAAVCLTLTQTRSAWLGGLVALLVFAGLWLRRASVSPRRSPIWLVPALLALAVGSAFVTLAASTNLGDPLAARARTLQSVGQDASWRSRVQTWRGALRMASVQPLLGFGLGRYPGAQWMWTRQGRPLSPSQRPSLSEQAHNLYLQTVVEIGGVGLTLYGLALATLAGRCRLALRRQGTHRRGLPQALSVATLSLLAGQGVDALASPSYQFSEVSLLFWACLGIGLAAVNRRETAESSVILPTPLRRALRFCAVGAVSVALVAQVVPIGLLTPVQAYYNAPAGWTYQSVSLSPTSITYPNSYAIQLTAIYLDSVNTPQSVPVTGDMNSYKILTSGAASSVTNSGALTVGKGDKGKVLTVTATFTDGTGTHQATAAVSVH